MPRHITLVVARSRAAGPAVRRLTLRDPDGWPLPRFRAGAHLDLHIPGVGPRAYSLCGDPAVADRWEIAVKREACSRGGSAWLHDVLAEGDVVHASMPRCTFPVQEGAARHVMIAGGIGVTPFLAMAHVLERQGADWSLHVLHRGEIPPCPAELAPWLASGRVVCHETRAARPSVAELLGPARPGVAAYCCGPASMLEAFEAATHDWPEGSAQVEHFVPPALLPDPLASAYRLRIASTGAEVEVGSGESMLAALNRLGVKVPTSCEGGICGACELRWLEGEPVHRDRVLSPARRATHLMACVAQCASSLLVIDA